MKNLEVTEIWQRYEKCLSYINRMALPERMNRCHRFYNGEQWYGIKTGGEDLPSLNFIKGLIKYKVTSVAQNNMMAVFTASDGSNEQENKVSEMLGSYFRRSWENGKLDSICRKIIKDAAIQGDSYIFFGSGGDITEPQVLDNVNVFLSDEQNSDLQEQKFIILRERRFVEDIIKEAEENGILKADIELITSDTDMFTQIGEKAEVNTHGKCVSLLYMEKDDEGFVHISRSVKNLIYQPDTVLRSSAGSVLGGGLKSYPIVNFLWDEKKGSARGLSEVEFLIPNQIEINKTIARRSIAVKQTAFPMLAYAANLINNPEDLDLIGGKIAVNNANAQSIDQIVTYLRPANISSDAKNLSDELLQLSRELSGAGDSSIGNVDPTQASGAAIIAVRDQAQLPLNDQIGRFMQLVEDLARMFIDMLLAYNPKGITADFEGKKERVSVDALEKMKINIHVDVIKNSPYNLYATEESLESFLKNGEITFEEFVEALPESGSIPKNRLREILEKRKRVENNTEVGEPAVDENKEITDELTARKGMLLEAMEKMKARG